MELTGRKSNAQNTFKAGEFSSGKMGDIFKQCFQGYMAYIDHKQFGRAYLVPEDVIAGIAIDKWLENKRAPEYLVYLGCSDRADFYNMPIEDRFHFIEDFYECDWIDWLEALRHISRAEND